MKNYGISYSNERPQELQILETKVFEYKNITEQTKIDPMTEEEIIEYSFELIEYDKNEYIKMIDAKNKELEDDVTSTELALCEVYELIGG